MAILELSGIRENYPRLNLENPKQQSTVFFDQRHKKYIYTRKYLYIKCNSDTLYISLSPVPDAKCFSHTHREEKRKRNAERMARGSDVLAKSLRQRHPDHVSRKSWQTAAWMSHRRHSLRNRIQTARQVSIPHFQCYNILA